MAHPSHVGAVVRGGRDRSGEVRHASFKAKHRCAARLGAGQSCVIDDFSAGAGRWSTQENQAGGSAFRVPPGEIEIENLIGNDALWSLPVNVLPGAAYTMTGRQRGEDITGVRVETGAPANRGASMGVLDPESFAYLGNVRSAVS